MWKQRKEKIKLEKIEKMKAELRKQGLIVDKVDSVKVDAIEQNPKPKYYGFDWNTDWIMEWKIDVI